MSRLKRRLTIATVTTRRHAADLHAHLRGLFHEALARTDIRHVMAERVKVRDGRLRIDELSYKLDSYKRVLLVAVGKAAIPMAEVAVSVLQPALDGEQTLTGIAVSADSGERLPAGVRFLQGSHPIPDDTSRRAAEAVVDLLRGAEATDLVLFLMSGGASSMLELPADPETTVGSTAQFYRALLYSGLPITAMNTLRKHMSAVKGGRLAALAAPATQCSLIVSDVPGDEGDALAIVGSGPSLPDATTLADCEAILASPQARAAFGSLEIQAMLRGALRETPKPGDAAFARTEAVCLLSNNDLVRNVHQLAVHAGYTVVVDNTCDDWDYRDASDYLLSRLLALRQQHRKACVISGGEVTVRVPESAGFGGRNQHFALYTAMQLSAGLPYVAVLSAASDGVDGNSPATGAIADSSTVERAERLGLRAAELLERFDSYRLFHALGDAIVTGPTGNNVRDMRVLLSD